MYQLQVQMLQREPLPVQLLQLQPVSCVLYAAIRHEPPPSDLRDNQAINNAAKLGIRLGNSTITTTPPIFCSYLPPPASLSQYRGILRPARPGPAASILRLALPLSPSPPLKAIRPMPPLPRYSPQNHSVACGLGLAVSSLDMTVSQRASERERKATRPKWRGGHKRRRWPPRPPRGLWFALWAPVRRVWFCVSWDALPA